MTLALATLPPDGPVRGTFLFLHGILGSGTNWRGFAKRLLARMPGVEGWLVDLRNHGRSLDFAAPHTLAACAADLRALVEERGAKLTHVLGHSFGGKVALAYADRHADLEQLFVIDSTPSARPDSRGSESTRHIVELLRNLPNEFANRGDFTAWLEAQGVSRPVAMWLAMNVRPIPNTTRFVFRVDIAGIRQMLDDYFMQDLWSALERPHPTMAAHLIAGGKSSVVDAADREHAKRCPDTTLDVIEKADHWVHVDAPDELTSLVLGYLDA